MGAAATLRATASDPSRDLYLAIGAFLTDQRLAIDPVNYAFAHRVLSQPNGPLALAVRALTDDGVRLSSRDIEALGGEYRVGGRDAAAAVPEPAGKQADRLVAQTQLQVEGFADMVSAMRDEAQGFGRDLAASADAMRGTEGGHHIVALTAAMIERIHASETRLEAATREANALREQLEEARDDARRDPLTDLPNRRGFVEAFAARSAAGEQLCLAVCDVDHFKLVNDRFGHAIGDRVLSVLGDSLAEACKGHVVSRYGGEEFAILFSGIEPEAARELLDYARGRIASRRYRVRENAEPLGAITFSAGFVAVVPDETIEIAFARADALLYAAKAAGRNCVRGD